MKYNVRNFHPFLFDLLIIYTMIRNVDNYEAYNL